MQQQWHLKRYRLILVDRHEMVIVANPNQEKCVLILLPGLYWAKKVSLPVTKASQARFFAASFFDGILPEGDYEYEAFGENGVFVVVAFSRQEIREAIERHGIEPSHIEAIFFAQSELKGNLLPLDLGNNFALVEYDGAVIQLPLSHIAGAKRWDLVCGDFYFSRRRFS
ncbi:MAG: hypothetical protein K6347_08310 [Campylobacterales bacterium]